MQEFHLRYEAYQKEFEEYARNYFAKIKTRPSLLGDSMRYSFENGGKRIRPVMALACAEVLRVTKEDILPFALAIEMIHTYSLIHDDLPAMDNDDFRRGKPSNHKQFGEANAILAGDALLNEAYAICLKQCFKGESFVEAACFLNDCAGAYGMIAGQSADLEFSKQTKEVTEEELLYIYAHKTGDLLVAPVVIPAILKNHKNFLELERFGKILGVLFQMTDDILDVTGKFDELGKQIGKDAEQNKLTCVRIYDLEGAKLRADLCAEECHIALEGVDGETDFLHKLIDYVLMRRK